MPGHQQIQQSKETQPSSQRQIIPVRHIHVSSPVAIIQRARIDPKSLTPADVMQLQRTIGNRAIGKLLSEIRNSSRVQQEPVQRQKLEEEETCPSCVQRQEAPEEEELIQGKMIETVQRQKAPEEEEKLLQGKTIEPIQLQEIPEKEKTLQGVFESKPEQTTCPSCSAFSITQRKELDEEETLQTKRENNTGIPDNLKAGVESLSGIDMSDVRVHHNSNKPAEVGALAYTQGTNIHVAPGQERHLPHETWHVVQQAQGRVQPTKQMKGVVVNDNVWLEREADVMGAKALANTARLLDEQELNSHEFIPVEYQKDGAVKHSDSQVIQRQNAVLASPYYASQAVKKVLMAHGFSDRAVEAGRDDILVVCADEGEVMNADRFVKEIKEQIKYGAELPRMITLVVCNAANMGAAGATLTSLGQEVANRLGVQVNASTTVVAASWDFNSMSLAISANYVSFFPQNPVDEISEKLGNIKLS